jgi:hypothetical protein
VNRPSSQALCGEPFVVGRAVGSNTLRDGVSVVAGNKTSHYLDFYEPVDISFWFLLSHFF